MNTRALALKALLLVLQDGQSLGMALEKTFDKKLAASDRAFVQALCFGVLRNFFELEALLNRLLRKPLKNKDLDIKLLALVGLYQLRSMRVKDYAAVSETVAVAKRQPWAKSLLNAVFREYQRQAEHLLPEIPHVNHPLWLIEAIQQDWPEHAGIIFQANNQAPPLTLRVYGRKQSRDVYMQLLSAQGIEAAVGEFSPVALTLCDPLPVEHIPGFASGVVSVQDEAAQLAALLLDLQPGQRVLDMCAAPGGKTCHILEQQSDIAELWALESDAQRVPRIHENLTRLGLQARVCQADATKLDWWDGRLFDRILVDAPCSALGVIRRHPDIKFLRRPEDMDLLSELQLRILKNAWQLLAPGGLLVYATCSILKRENERQILDFLAAQPDAIEIPIVAEWGIAREVGRQILPGSANMDGFYYARLQKQSV